jgi:hypothetical protein
MRASFPVLSALAVAASVAVSAQQNPYLGRWNMTGTGADSASVYWLEVTDAGGGALSGMFLNRTGNPVRLASVRLEQDELVFVHQPRPNMTPIEFRARHENGRLIGRHTLPARGRRGGAAATTPPPAGRLIDWVGVRPPAWPNVNANGRHTLGEPVALFDGSSLDAFGAQNPNREMGWTVTDGVMSNGDGASNLVSRQVFTDFKVEAEYRLGPDSNSGLYLRGRYELQILDDHDKPNERPDFRHMAIYGRTPPLANASRPVGEWQRMEAILVGNRVTVTLNGQRVQDNAVIDGITGGALDANESEPGPILIQGDHSGVWIRKLVVTPVLTVGR